MTTDRGGDSMSSEEITLNEEHTEQNSRHLWASITEDADLMIQGQDLGPTVEQFWGSDLSEYEWNIIVRSPDIPRLIAALGGKDGDNVLSLLAARCSESEEYASKSFLDEHGVPAEFWSRVGD
jgi:hypothetical protein